MQHYVVGSRVNLEVDVISRYLERLMLGEHAAETSEKQQSTMELLAKSGFMG